MIDLKTNKKSELTFKLNIEGSPQEAPKARIVIELQNKSYIAIEGNVLKDKVTVEIPPLKNLKEEFLLEKAKCYLEVIIGESYFVPWQNEFNLKDPISVKAEATENEDLKENQESPTKVSISIDSVTEKEEDTVVPEKNEELLTEEGVVEEEEPNDNLKQLMKEDEKVFEEKEEEEVEVVEEEPEEEPKVEEKSKPQPKLKKEHKKKYTYNDFLENQNISARDYLDSLFEKESE